MHNRMDSIKCSGCCLGSKGKW